MNFLLTAALSVAIVRAKYYNMCTFYIRQRQAYRRKIYAFAAKTAMTQTRFGHNCARKAKLAVSIRIVKYKIGKIYYVRVRDSAADGKE